MRRIVFPICGAVVALGLGGATSTPSAHEDARQAETQQNLNSAAPAVSGDITKQPETTQPTLLNSPCEPGEDERRSDLCAQWKAVDAAREAARWAFWSTVISLFGVVGLVWNINQGRKALKSAGEANQTAQDTLTDSQAQRAKENRAWVGMTSFEVHGQQETEAGRLALIGGKVWFENMGKTPAKDFRISAEPVRVSADGSIVVPEAPEWEGGGTVVLPGQRMSTSKLLFPAGDVLAASKAQIADWYFYVGITYTDVYEPHVVRKTEWLMGITFANDPAKWRSAEDMVHGVLMSPSEHGFYRVS